MRYIRVPRGESVKFDKATQSFTIPRNTRFYKTFLKQVRDVSGKETYRKIETRVIVSRPDTTAPDGTAQQNALFGTYVWNEDETQATLLTDPLRDGKPFADRLFEYITDEQADLAIVASIHPTCRPRARGRRRRAPLRASREPSAASSATWAARARTSCSGSRRSRWRGGRPAPAASTSRPTGDELTQLQRLIDYGVITGMASPRDILPLEESEGSRQPRNAYELNAQAYMVGNCAHCHNPRGFPSVRSSPR